MLRVWKSDLLSVFIPDYNGRIYTWLQPRPRVSFTRNDAVIQSKHRRAHEAIRECSGNLFDAAGAKTNSGEVVLPFVGQPLSSRGAHFCCQANARLTAGSVPPLFPLRVKKSKHVIFQVFELITTSYTQHTNTSCSKVSPHEATHERRGARGLTLGLSQKHQSDTLTKIKPLKPPPSWKPLSPRCHCYLRMCTQYSFRGFAYIYLLFLKTAFVRSLNLPGFKLLSLTQVVQS